MQPPDPPAPPISAGSSSRARRAGGAAVLLLLGALGALGAWQTSAGLDHIDRMMGERSETLRRMVATEIRNVARYGAARRERLDEVLRELAASADVAGVVLERIDGTFRLAHGALPPAARLAALGSGRALVGDALLVAGPVRIETHGCGGGRDSCGASHAACDTFGCGSEAGRAGALDGDYRVVLALDARPYRHLRRSVWLQGLAGGVLLLALAAGLALLDRQGRRASAMREELVVAGERTRYLERLGLVAAGLAHEIKNPLGSLRGFTQLIAEGAAPGSRGAEYAGLMLAELDGITRRVEGLRHFARPAPASLGPARPAEVVRRVAALLQPDLTARALSLDLDAPAAPGPEAVADEDRLRDLVVNLLMNAIEASPRGGRISLRLAHDPGTDLFTLEVADEGPGIPRNERERALRPFHSTKAGGLGLGLALAQRAVEDHAGTLAIDETPAGGALLRARWPRGAGRAG